MSLEQLSKTVDFVQDATPSDANDGETYLDTSLSPPQLKVFDSSVGGFIEPRSIQNLDAPVSDAGQGVDWATKTPDVESTTGSTIQGNTDTVNISVNGSGFLLGAEFRTTDGVSPPGASFIDALIRADSSDVMVVPMTPNVNGGQGQIVDGTPDDYIRVDISGIIRFDSSLSIGFRNGSASTSNDGSVIVSYALD